MTQRKYRSLALVQPTLLDDGGMRISAPGMPEIAFERPSGPVITVDSHFRIPVSARDAGDEAAEWLTELIGVPLRLVRMEGDSGWRLPPELDVFGQGAAFTDAAPVLVANQGSLDWLVAALLEDFGMDRFRPNLVVTGAEPWVEDTWDRFDVGEANLRAIVPWPRARSPKSTNRPPSDARSQRESSRSIAGVHRRHRFRATYARSSKAMGSSVWPALSAEWTRRSRSAMG